MKGRVIAALVFTALLWPARMAWDLLRSREHCAFVDAAAFEVHRRAIYEYRAATGKWPASVDDLAQTALARQSPHYWRQAAAVILWPSKDMKPSPQENAQVLLAHYKDDLFNQLGRVWVCRQTYGPNICRSQS